MKGKYISAVPKSLEIQPDFEKGLICLGNICAKQNLFDEAIDNYDKILKNDPKNEMCLFNKAYTYFLKKDYQEASKIFGEIINNNPENEEAKIGLGLCYYELKDYDNAIKQFDLNL